MSKKSQRVNLQVTYLMCVALIVDNVISFLSHRPVEQSIVVSGPLITNYVQGGKVVSENAKFLRNLLAICKLVQNLLL